MNVVYVHMGLCVHKHHICCVLARCWLSFFICIIPVNFHDKPMSHSHLTDGEMEAQKGKVACFRLHK